MPQDNDDSLSPDPVVGDGVVTIPFSDEENTVSQIDLPPNIASQLLQESVTNNQANNRQGRDTFTLASGSLQAGIAKTLNELGPVESRAVSGVMATPVASPAVQQS